MKTSANPWRQYCGSSQKTVIGMTAVGWSKRLCCAAAVFRLISINPEAIVARMLITKPIPIRCRQVMPTGLPVNRRATGTKRRSYRGKPIRTVRVLNIDMLAGGIWKEGDRWRSMLRACWIVKLPKWECEATRSIVAAHIGSIRMMDFNSSILCTVASLHRFG